MQKSFNQHLHIHLCNFIPIAIKNNDVESIFFMIEIPEKEAKRNFFIMI